MTDYESSSVCATLYDYDFDDNYTDLRKKPKVAAINWEALVDGLVRAAIHDARYFVTKDARVTCVRRVTHQEEDGHCNFLVQYRSRSSKSPVQTLACRRIVFATASRAIVKLRPELSGITRELRPQSFLRAYARVDRSASAEFQKAIKTYTVVPGPLQKIIPIDVEEGVYMVAYSDNESADLLYRMGFGRTKSTCNQRLKQRMCRLICRSLGLRENVDIHSSLLRITDLVVFYWRGGTHYYRPSASAESGVSRDLFLRRTLFPESHVTVLGEGFSRDQGWTEGALQRVEDAFFSKDACPGASMPVKKTNKRI